MFKWLIKLLGGKSEKPVIRETTQHFKDFVKLYFLENPGVIYESEDNLLCRYILQTKKSPYVGDESLAMARETLKRNGVRIVI